MKRGAKLPLRLPLLTMGALSALFAAVIVGITFNLRSALRREVLQHEAESIEAVALLQLRSNHPDLAKLGALDGTQDVFAAVLESSRLRGVLAVQLLDTNGKVQASLPYNENFPQEPWRARAFSAKQPLARLHPEGNLEDVYGFPEDKSRSGSNVPLLEVLVPLRLSDPETPFGVAHYWIDGASITREFSRIDHGLAGQASIAFLVSSAALAGVLYWAFTRLEESNRRLRLQGEDLALANQELAFAAKTAAIGAISAHLIHEIKNPLTGLECFVTDQVGRPGAPCPPEGWVMAAEATRRLRDLINQVVGVLRDETSPNSHYTVTAAELIESVRSRVSEIAAKRGIAIVCTAPAELELKARTSHLAALILTNLVGNALEASRPGTQVLITAFDQGAEIDFEVRDAGPGLPAQVRDSLFQPIASDKPGGSGIGLAISRQLAQHVGGRLELRQTGSTGTVFSLAVPGSKTADIVGLLSP